ERGRFPQRLRLLWWQLAEGPGDPFRELGEIASAGQATGQLDVVQSRVDAHAVEDVDDVDVIRERFLATPQQRRDLGIDELAPNRKSTRLNSSHVKISYAVFCLKKKIVIFDYIFLHIYKFGIHIKISLI